MDAEVALTNKIMLVNALAVVVPQAKMPNQLLGILFGQISCINRLRYESTPREFLVAKDEKIFGVILSSKNTSTTMETLSWFEIVSFLFFAINPLC